MFDRYTRSATRALFFARSEVQRLGGRVIEPEHLVLGVLEGSPHAIVRFARAAGAGYFTLRTRLADAVRAPEDVAASGEIPFSPATIRVIERTPIEADDLGNRWIRPEHLVIAVMVETDAAATRALRDAGVEPDAIRDYLRGRPEDIEDRAGACSVPPSVIRQWKGLIKPGLAEEYIRHLHEETLPSLRAIPGFVYATILRREVEDGTEFQVQTFWRSFDAIKAFAGDDITVAVVPPAAQELMVRYDDHVVHYQAVQSATSDHR
ncbi:MAG TPA: Clp protease N-terminal domain-containing protein [Vicinamibacterales bacterium]